ncbi:polysaccharide pyruvyl transferase family protein [Hyunsoonleella ulvae]|uniref:polysaccharide pyruvyl transferase family protein n=1 Tax=Hyunsoonleella ulvae TaxID=2799948 RepID=UPI00193A66E3|nr:polysaccharide pyruvyl transferase family protein [Hyunsoonleella ulvae]
MIVLLSGQIKNIGDFLITDRAKKLFEYFVDSDIVILDRTKKLNNQLDIINKSRFVVLCGGPAYASNIYKGIYPLVDDLSLIKVPIIPFGLGWSGFPIGKPMDFKFNKESLDFLNSVHSSIDYSSCRDEITESVVKNNGFNNVKMTGCPVWYDLRYIDDSFTDFTAKNIVITTPAAPRLFWQTIKLVALMKKEFPSAENFYMTFHRGIMPDKYTKFVTSIGYILMCIGSKVLIPKMKIRDVSYKMEKIDFYQEMDFHIGYRVHAHLYFLSQRKPSVLINEDGRGVGMVKTLGLPILNIDDKELFNKIRNTLRTYKNNDIGDFKRVKKVFDEKFSVMKSFLANLKTKYN